MVIKSIIICFHGRGTVECSLKSHIVIGMQQFHAVLVVQVLIIVSSKQELQI